MSHLATSAQMERLLAELREHNRADDARLGAITLRLDAHGETLARIDERTQEHAKRMDRADRRATAIGGGIGGAVALAVALVKERFFSGA